MHVQNKPKPKDFETHDTYPDLNGYVTDPRHADGSGILSWIVMAIVVGFMVFIVGLRSCGAQDDVVVQTIAREASGEPLEAQVLVAKVIRQRAEERRLTPEEVCLQPYQFSCWLVKQTPRTGKELRIARQAWELSKELQVKVSHYFDDSIDPPGWAKKMRFVKKAGRLNFYYIRGAR